MKSKLTKKDFVFILSKYYLGVLKGLEFFTSGSVQANILLKTSKGKFVLRYYKLNRPKRSVEFEVNLINYLKKHKYPCPAPIKNKKGEFIGSYRSKPYAIFEFVEGKHIKKPTKAQNKQLTQKVAELQNILKNYKPVNKKYRWNYSPELCKKLAQKEAKKIATNNAKEKLKWLTSELGKLKLPKSLPKGVCHCDFHFANILFRGGRFNALIDFDDANWTYCVFDLACLMEPFKPSFSWNNWKKFKINERIIDLKDSRTIVSMYMKYRSLSNVEKKYLFDVFKLTVLFDCVWYFKRGNVKDFYEKRKIDALNNLGREEFYKGIFGK